MCCHNMGISPHDKGSHDVIGIPHAWKIYVNVHIQSIQITFDGLMENKVQTEADRLSAEQKEGLNESAAQHNQST